MVPTDCLMIQEPLVTRGMSLKVLLRRASASLLSPPARNLPMHPNLVILELYEPSAAAASIGRQHRSCLPQVLMVKAFLEAACAVLHMSGDIIT